ncbi:MULTISPECIES: VOC family protein [Variovorax]|uniref:VOC family protein n=1 Tax=Variovorax TaxID=34072 RepID=UPI00036C5A50|nr:VOC family protein [Variovorax paradoxus]
MANAGVGAIMQVAYLVEDIDKAMARWAAMGVGPFFVGRHLKYAVQTHRGEDISADISAAFAYVGDLQIELMQQHNDAPSSLTEFKSVHGFGSHHLGILSKDIDADAAALVERGLKPISRWVSAIGVETRFFEAELDGGSVIELIQSSPAVEDGFAQMKAASAAWDRSGPAYFEF